MENILSILSSSKSDNITVSQIFNNTLIKKYPFDIKDFYISKTNSLIPSLLNNKFSILYSHFKEVTINYYFNEELDIYYKLDESKIFLSEILKHEKNNKPININKIPNYFALEVSIRNVLYDCLLSKKNLIIIKTIENQEIEQHFKRKLYENYNLENSNNFIKNFLNDSEIYLNNIKNSDSKKNINNDENFNEINMIIEKNDKSQTCRKNITKKNISKKLKLLLAMNNNDDNSIKEIKEIKKLILKISDCDKTINHNLTTNVYFNSNKKLSIDNSSKNNIKYSNSKTLNNYSINNTPKIKIFKIFQKKKNNSKINTKFIRIDSSCSDKEEIKFKSETIFKYKNKKYDKKIYNNSFKIGNNKNFFLANTKKFKEKYKENKKNIISFYENWNNNNEIINRFNYKDNMNNYNNTNKNIILSNLKGNFNNKNFKFNSVDTDNFFKKKSQIISNNTITNRKSPKKIFHSINPEIYKNNIERRINGFNSNNRAMKFKLNQKFFLLVSNKNKNPKSKISLLRNKKNNYNTRYEKNKSSQNIIIQKNIFKYFNVNEDFNNNK